MYDLALVIITYNRAALLDGLLASLATSFLKDCPIWVLDNASTDETPAVCKHWLNRFANFTVVRHRYNIGVNANILRAYEFGDCYYKWILCDDDELHLDDAGDLSSALLRKQHDLIQVIGGGEYDSGQTKTLKDWLESKKSLAYYSLSFVPGIIFRANIVEDTVKVGYLYAYTRYQHVFVMLKGLSSNSTVYTTLQPAVVRGREPAGIGSEIWIFWHQGLDALSTRRARTVALSWRKDREGLLNHVFRFGRFMVGDLRNGRSRRDIMAVWLRALMLTPSVKGRAAVLVNLLFIFAPTGLLYRMMRGKPLVRGNFEQTQRARE